MREFHANGLIYRMPEWFNCIRPHYRGEGRRLIRSIKDHGQLQPIVVASTGEPNTYDLVDGLARLVACFKLQVVPQVVFTKDVANLKDLRIALNVNRRQLLAEEMKETRTAGKAKETLPLKDEAGFPLPARVQEAFAGRSLIFSMAGELHKMRRRLAELLDEPVTADMLSGAAIASLEQARRLLRSGAAAYLCPTCRAEKRECQQCNSRGWFSTLGYRAYQRRMSAQQHSGDPLDAGEYSFCTNALNGCPRCKWAEMKVITRPTCPSESASP